MCETYLPSNEIELWSTNIQLCMKVFVVSKFRFENTKNMRLKDNYEMKINMKMIVESA